MQRPPAGAIPETPGSYQFKDTHGRVIYVGKAGNLRQRRSDVDSGGPTSTAARGSSPRQ